MFYVESGRAASPFWGSRRKADVLERPTGKRLTARGMRTGRSSPVSCMVDSVPKRTVRGGSGLNASAPRSPGGRGLSPSIPELAAYAASRTHSKYWQCDGHSGGPQDALLEPRRGLLERVRRLGGGAASSRGG